MLGITSLSAVPSLGAMLGSRGSDELIKAINHSLGPTSYFGTSADRFSHLQNQFMDMYVRPIKQANSIVNVCADKFLGKEDTYKVIDTLAKFKEVPQCMQLPIVTYDPLYKLLKKGAIVGYGYDADEIVDQKEMFDRLCYHNGHVDYADENVYKHDEELNFTYVEEVHEFKGTDIELTLEQISFIQETRDAIDRLMKETDLDLTYPTELHG